MSNENLLDRVIALIEQDIESAEKRTEGLDISTSKKLTDYAKTLVILNKDNREQLKVGDWDSLSTEEMKEKVKEAHELMENEPEDSER